MRVAVIPFALLMALSVGCDALDREAESVVVTNVVTVTRAVTVTNVVTVATTNRVTVVAARVLSARKTSPYIVSTSAMRGAELRKFLQTAGARIIECSPGAQALVEAPDVVVKAMKTGSVVTVSAIPGADKIPPEIGSQVAIVPLSAIDCDVIAAAVERVGGTVLEVRRTGEVAVRAKLSGKQLETIAERGDVLAIRRDTK